MKSSDLSPSIQLLRLKLMKTIYFAASSLDGYIADNNNSLEWLFQFPEAAVDNYIESFVNSVGALAMGSTTYEWILNHMKPGEKWPYQAPAFVFTHKKRDPIPDANITFVSGDVRPIHEMMKQLANKKNIWIVGGGDLAGQFYDAHLLDQLIIQIASVTLGSGAPLFPRHLSKPLKLESVKRLSEEFVELIYQT